MDCRHALSMLVLGVWVGTLAGCAGDNRADSSSGTMALGGDDRNEREGAGQGEGQTWHQGTPVELSGRGPVEILAAGVDGGWNSQRFRAL